MSVILIIFVIVMILIIFCSFLIQFEHVNSTLSGKGNKGSIEINKPLIIKSSKL